LIDSGNNTSFSGTTTLSGNVQNKARIILSGQEFYRGGQTSTDGIALLLGVNRPNNKQLGITNSANLAQNGTNAIVRISAETSGYIDCIGTNGTTPLPLSIGGSSITLVPLTNLNSGNNFYIKCGANANGYYLNVGSTSEASSTMFDSVSCGVWSSFTGALHLNPSTASNKVYINFYNTSSNLAVGNATGDAKCRNWDGINW
jgi:hypothetical protein